MGVDARTLRLAIASTRLRSLAVPLLVGALLAGGLLLRLQGIATPSVEQRETQSAVRIRTWYQGDAGLPAWKQRVLHELRARVGLIEPPITDGIVYVQYRIAGENFWFPRLLSACYWVIGGLFLYLIATRLTTPAGALVALALYLTWPFAALHSRLFMPDALMVGSMLAAALTVLRYWERPSWRRLLAAGAVSSVATAVKPGAAYFFLVCLFVALAVSHRSLRASITGGRLPAYAGLAAITAATYYLLGTRVFDYIWEFASSNRLTPGRVLEGVWWERWWGSVAHLLVFPQTQTIVAVIPLAAAGAAVAVARRPHARATLIGLLAGYAAFTVTFAYYVSGNPYYSLPLIPILALAIGVVAGAALGRSRGSATRAGLIGAIVLMVAVAAYKSAVMLDVPDPSARIADYRRIGDLTGHTLHSLIVDERLSSPIMYWGWIVGDDWDLSYETPPPWSNSETADFLVVVGAFGRQALESHPGLREYTRGLPVFARTDESVIFDLRRRNRRS